MFRQWISRILLVLGSIITFYALLVVGVLIPLLHQENFQEFLKDNINERLLLAHNLSMEYANMDITLYPFSVSLNNFQLRTRPQSTPPTEDAQDIIIETPRLEGRISFSRLILGRLLFKEIRVRLPRLFIHLTDSPADLTQAIKTPELSNVTHFILQVLSPFIHRLHMDNAQIIFERGKRTRLEVKSLTASSDFFFNRIYTEMDAKDLSFSGHMGSFELNHVKTAAVLRKNAISISNLTLSHEHLALAVASATLEDFSTYDISGIALNTTGESLGTVSQMTALSSWLPLPPIQGHMQLEAHLKGVVGSRPQGSALFHSQQLSVDGLAFDTVDIPLVLTDTHLEIKNGRLHGRYGTIHIPTVSIALSNTYAISGNIEPQDLHFSQFLAAMGEDECLSFFDVNGPITLNGSLSPLILSGNTSLNISSFFVTPSMQEAAYPQNAIISFPSGTLVGDFTVTSEHTLFNRFTLTVDQSRLTVAGKLLHQDPVRVNLDVTSDFTDLGHLKTISSVPVTGKGPLSTHITVNENGLFIQGRLAMSDAVVGPYTLSKFSSHVAYADERLHFQTVKIEEEDAQVVGEVQLNFRDEFSLRVSADIKQANVRYLKKFLGPEHDFYLKYLDEGAFFGHILLSGPPTPSKMFGRYTLKGRNIYFAQENIDEFAAKGSFGSARMDFEEIWLKKGAASLNVSGHLGTGAVYNLKFSSEPIPLSAFRVLSSRNRNISGIAHIIGRVTGPFDNPDVRVSFKVPDASISGAVLPPNLLFEMIYNNHTIDLSVFQDTHPWIKGTYDTRNEETFKVHVDITHFPWMTFLGLIYPHMLTRGNQATLTLKGNLEGSLSQFFKTTHGNINVSSFELKDGSQALHLDNAAALTFNSGIGGSSTSALKFVDENGNEMSVNVSFTPQNPVSIRASGSLSAYFVNAITHVVSSLRGIITGDIALTYGTLSTTSDMGWRVSSQAGIHSDQLYIRFPFMPDEVVFSPFDAVIQNGKWVVDNLTGTLKEGKIIFNGASGFNAKTFEPQPDITVRLVNAILSLPEWMNGNYDGTVTLRGDTPPYLLKGRIELNDGRNLRPFPVAQRKASVFERTLGFKHKLHPLLKLDLDVIAPPQSFQATYAFLNANVGGYIHLSNTPEDLELGGQIQSYSGTLRFRTHEFALQKMDIHFDPKDMWKSRLFLQAGTTIKGYYVKLNVRGVLDNYEYEFTTVPSLPQREIWALILFGRLHEDLSNADQTELLQIELGSSIIQQIPLTESVEKETGLAFKISSSSAQDTASSSFTVSKKMAKNLEAQVSAELGSETSRAVSLEYDFSNRVSLRGSLREETLSIRQLQAPRSRQHVGVDLRIKSEFD